MKHFKSIHHNCLLRNDQLWLFIVYQHLHVDRQNRNQFLFLFTSVFVEQNIEYSFHGNSMKTHLLQMILNKMNYNDACLINSYLWYYPQRLLNLLSHLIMFTGSLHSQSVIQWRDKYVQSDKSLTIQINYNFRFKCLI